MPRNDLFNSQFHFYFIHYGHGMGNKTHHNIKCFNEYTENRGTLLTNIL